MLLAIKYHQSDLHDVAPRLLEIKEDLFVLLFSNSIRMSCYSILSLKRKLKPFLAGFDSEWDSALGTRSD